VIPLLIGLVCAWAALRELSSPRAAAAGRRPRRGDALLVGCLGALVLLQLWTHRNDIARYRFSLVGLRFALLDEQARPVATPIRVSGDYDEADLYIPGAGPADVARLLPTGDSAGTVLLDLPDDAGALALVEERLPLGRTRWRVPAALPVRNGDTVVIRARGAIHRLTLSTVPDTLEILGARIPLPWTDRHVVTREDSAGRGAVVLPASGLGAAHRLRGARPSVFARSYPLADVVEALDTAAVWGLPPLTSFFFYDRGQLLLADLDSELDVVRSAASASVAPPPLSDGRAGARVLIAALPLRDYPELRLALPERYGIRPVRSVALSVRGEWLDITFATPEVQALDRDALEALRLPGYSDRDDRYRIRVSHARNSLVRQAVVFEAPSRAFATASQAVLALERNPRAHRYEIVTPAGLASAETGRPVPLGTRQRAILLRVDGQGTSPSFWLVHAGLFLLVAALFHVRRPRRGVFALALASAGLLGIRLLLGSSAMLEYPFVQEAHQIGLWLLPVLPWAIVLAADAASDDPPNPRVLWFHGVYAALIVTLTVVLFVDSAAKQVVLSLVPVALLATIGARGFARTRARGAGAVHTTRGAALTRVRTSRARTRIGQLARRFGWGWAAGAALLVLRALLDVAGWREGIMLGGTRIAVSVLYTPLTLAALAFVVRRHDRRIARSLPHTRPRHAVAALADIGAFVALAYAATAFWISDFGIALVGLPGVLVLLAILGARWTGGQRGIARLAFSLPLVLFVLTQSAPGVMRPVWGAGEGEGRLGEWNRNELLLLERGDPHALRRIGQRRSEALAVMRETMRSYTRGNWFGRGFLEGRVSSEIQDTATREHLVSALLASQWGLAGVTGLLVLLLAFAAPIATTSILPHAAAATPLLRGAAGTFAVLFIGALVLPGVFAALFVFGCAAALLAAFALQSGSTANVSGGDTEELRYREVLAALLLLTVAGAGVYMVLANYGWTFFTGKNVYLLGLDSVSDALEGGILLALAAAMLAADRPVAVAEPAPLRAARPAVASPHRRAVPVALPSGTR
jgi:hypothetical protein